MEHEKKFIQKTDDCVDLIIDSTYTIPVQLGQELFCTINFIKHRMDLQIGDDNQFNNKVSLTKEVVASITLTESHALELSEIIKSQISALKQQIDSEA